MRDFIPAATLLFAEILMVAGGMLMYRLVSGNIIKRNMLAKVVRQEGPGDYWQAIALPFFCSCLLPFVCYKRSGLKR
jgi:hypothetical protein